MRQDRARRRHVLSGGFSRGGSTLCLPASALLILALVPVFGPWPAQGGSRLSSDWRFESDQAGARLGRAVAVAGDVNGDGFSDLIVGAPEYDGAHTDAGRVYLFLGSTSGLSESPDWSTDGSQAGAYFGSAVAPAGDVNNDGYDDVLIGASGYDNGQIDEGKAYLYLGSPSGLSPTPIWSIEGNQTGAFLGHSLCTAGDVDGDGYDDIAVGAYGYDGVFTDCGRVLFFKGSASGPSTVPSLTLDGEEAGAWFGRSVSTGGDVNGDGLADLLIGSPLYDGGVTDQGKAYLFAGSASNLSSTSLWTRVGGQADSWFGHSVSLAGDTNGDGYADIAVGAHLYNDNGKTDAGQVSLFLGGSSGPGTQADWTRTGAAARAYYGHSLGPAGDADGDGRADLIVGSYGHEETLYREGRAELFLGTPQGPDDDPYWTAVGGQQEAYFGSAVCTSGDVNGDGFSDWVVGAHLYSGGENREGAVFVFYGAARPPSETPVWSVQGDQLESYLGSVVAPAGDVNGDGYMDMALGAPQFDANAGDDGQAWLYLGSDQGPEPIPAWTATGAAAGSQLGASMAGVGDVNGDGYDDLAVGEPGYSNGLAGRGRVQLFLGSAGGLSATASWIAVGAQANEQFGAAVAGAGDVNGDGYGDLLIGAPGFTNGQTGEGRALLYLGSESGLPSTAAWSAEGDQSLAGFGRTLAGGIDIDGNGCSDIAVGAQKYDSGQFDCGLVRVYLGSTSGLGSSPAWQMVGDQGFSEFGSALAGAGDVNGDGFGDLLVGVHYFDDGDLDVGQARLFLGSPSGPVDPPAWTFQGAAASSYLGRALSGCGDLNGDGFSDWMVGAPNFADGEPGEGKVLVFLGSPSPASALPAWEMEGNVQNASFGSATAGCGDVNGDGLSDLLIGARGMDDGQWREGMAFVYLGNAGGDSDHGRRRHPAQRSLSNRNIPLRGLSDSETSVRLAAIGHSAAGRTRVRLEWNVIPAGTGSVAWSHAGAGSNRGAASRSAAGYTPWLDTGAPLPGPGSTAELVSQVGGLIEGAPYGWRARVQSRSPYFPRSFWMTASRSVPTEIQFRTAGGGPGGFVRGDVDASGEINISDPIYSLAYQFGGGPAPLCLDAADDDDSGVVDISDPIYSLTHQFAGGPVFPAPNGSCGTDPTMDDLDCAEYPPCETFLAAWERTSETDSGPVTGEDPPPRLVVRSEDSEEFALELGRPVLSRDGTWRLSVSLYSDAPLAGFEGAVLYDSRRFEYAGFVKNPGLEADFLSAGPGLAVESAPATLASVPVIRLGCVCDFALSASIPSGSHRVGVLEFRPLDDPSGGSGQEGAAGWTVSRARFVTQTLVSLEARGPLDLAVLQTGVEPSGIGRISAAGEETLNESSVPGWRMPNPFRPGGALCLDLPSPMPVRLAVYDVTGRQVALMTDGHRSAGIHEFMWDGRGAAGAALPSGVYFLRLHWPGGEQGRTVVLLRDR